MARISRVGVSRGREGASTLKQIASALAKKYYDKGSPDNDHFFSIKSTNQEGSSQGEGLDSFRKENIWRGVEKVDQTRQEEGGVGRSEEQDAGGGQPARGLRHRRRREV